MKKNDGKKTPLANSLIRKLKIAIQKFLVKTNVMLGTATNTENIKRLLMFPSFLAKYGAKRLPNIINIL